MPVAPVGVVESSNTAALAQVQLSANPRLNLRSSLVLSRRKPLRIRLHPLTRCKHSPTGMEVQNNRAVDEFEGLSPTHMGALLGQLPGREQVVQLASLAEVPIAPIIQLFELLIVAIGDNGVYGELRTVR
jgi:hypothetical protein